MADNKTVQDLRKIERAFVKLRNNLKRADLDYTVQVSINSTDPTHVAYACQMTAPANGLAPLTFIATSADELIAKVKVATENIDYDAVEVAYHEAQIEACKRTILGHEERIAEIRGSSDEEAAPEESSDESEQAS